MGAVETRCQPRLAACGEFPSLCLPAGSAWHRDGTCWEAAHVMGGVMGGVPVLGDPLPLVEGKAMP